MVDLDILCAPGQIEQAAEMICSLGFRRCHHPAFRMRRKALHDVQLHAPGVQIELHYRLWHELQLASEVGGLIERAVEIPLGAGSVFVPSAADHLFFVLVHAAIHALAGNAMWLPDALLLATEAGSGVWALAFERAKQHGAALPFAVAMDHFVIVFPGVVPDDIWIETHRLRRIALRHLGPWLQRGELDLGLWPSRLVRALLLDHPGLFVSWASDKAALWLSQRGPKSRGALQ